jgi:hypothetical protein
VRILLPVKRIQIHIDDDLDRAAAAEADRRGISKAALIRASLEKELGPASPPPDDAWEAMIGWLDDDPVDDIDAVIYGPKG